MNKDLLLAINIAKEVDKIGGKTYFVGGYVRDKLLHIDNNDIDIEIHYVSEDDLKKILSLFGNYYLQGLSFGIYKIDGYSLDIALPRSEIKTGNKHNDFNIIVNPFIGEKKAALRRDFTINAIYENVLTHELLDYYNGINDLNNHLIKHIDNDKFKEDPLRVLRCAMFASRFNFTIDNETLLLCKSMDISYLSKERIYSEVCKVLLKSYKPSIFFNYLKKMNQLHYWFKELEDLINLKQHHLYHREGDVFTHTMLVLDYGNTFKHLTSHPLYFMFSCLCHDFGKKEAYVIKDNIIHSYNHEVLGVDISKVFIKRLTDNKKLIRYVSNMVLLHMEPNMKLYNNAKISSTNKMFDKSINPYDLVLLSHCDSLGRIPSRDDYYDEKLRRLNIYYDTVSKPFINGNDLKDLGIKEGHYYKEILVFARKLYLANISKENILKQIKGQYKKLID